MTESDAGQWIQILLLGGLAGALGQAARTVVGIKKVHDLAAAESVEPENLIVASRLFISLTIGFVAGALAILFIDLDITKVSTSQILGLAATGYAGADFIEGIISKVAPSEAGAPGNRTATDPGIAPPAEPMTAPKLADDYLG
jgi:hypothetical protein